MQRFDFIKESENTREMSELILPLVCKHSKDCDRNCAECTEDLKKFLEEEL